jgi:hypothetical protein
LVGSLAWPAVVIIAVVVFRKELLKLLERPMSRLKVGPVEANWQEVESFVKQNLAGKQGRVVPLSGRTDWEFNAEAKLSSVPAVNGQANDSLSELTPRAIVEGRWTVLEEELRAIVRRAGIVPDDYVERADFDQLLDAALTSGVINAATLRSLDGLRHMRNLALSRGHPTPEQAEDFAVLAGATLYAMQGPPAG